VLQNTYPRGSIFCLTATTNRAPNALNFIASLAALVPPPRVLRAGLVERAVEHAHDLGRLVRHDRALAPCSPM
jgi:hypothetical protein